MSFPRPIEWYHSHTDPIWPDGTFKPENINIKRTSSQDEYFWKVYKKKSENEIKTSNLRIINYILTLFHKSLNYHCMNFFSVHNPLWMPKKSGK